MARTFQVTNIFPQLTAEQNVAVPLLAKAGRALVALSALDRMPDVQESARRMLADVGLSDSRDPAPPRNCRTRSKAARDRAGAGDRPAPAAPGRADRRMGSGERDRMLAEIRGWRERPPHHPAGRARHDVVFGWRPASSFCTRQGAGGRRSAQIREDARVRGVYLGQPTGAAAARPAPRAASHCSRREAERRLRACARAARVSFRIARGELVALLGRNGVARRPRCAAWPA